MRSLSLILLSLLLVSINAYKILGLFPYPAKSHYTVFNALMVELANRGHQVTVYNTFVKNSQIRNYKEVDIKQCFSLPDVLTIEQMLIMNGAMGLAFGFPTFLPKEEEIFRCQPLIDLSKSAESYDLFITESFLSDFFQYFGHQLKTPVIAFHSNTPLPWMADQTGLPQNPSYIPHPYEPFPERMSFLQRNLNTIYYLHSMVAYKTQSESTATEMGHRFFNRSVPDLDTLTRNVSMLFLYSHFTLNRARPLVPNVVEVAGLNIKPASPLPQNIQNFLNESNHGVVYFCMGSLLQGKTFPAAKRDAFLYAFSKIPQRVLWKWEEDELPGKPKNVMTAKWMPQRDILAHPNVKLFISHGGLLGTSEAVYEGVPVLGIPIFGDQRSNIYALKSYGAAELLDYNDISNNAVLEKIQSVLNNRSYQKSAHQLSRLYKDRPMSPLDTAVYWTEYVIRHKGAHHLKSAAIDMPWYQYLLLDVMGFLLLVLLTVITVFYYSIKSFFKFIATRVIGEKPCKSLAKSKKFN